MAERPRVAFRRSRSGLPVGSIVFNLERALNNAGDPAAAVLVQEKFDDAHGDRLDYRLWRRTFVEFQRGRKSVRVPLTKRFSQPIQSHNFSLGSLFRALRTTSPAERWGALAVLAARGGQRIESGLTAQIVGDRAAALALLNYVNSLAPLPELPWACMMVAAIVRAKLLDHLGNLIDATDLGGDAVMKSVARVTQTSLEVTRQQLERLDPDFYAGGRLDLRALRTEEENFGRLLPLDTITMGFRDIGWALQHLALAGHRWLTDIDTTTGWRTDAFVCACAAWRVRRWQRLFQEKQSFEGSGPDTLNQQLYYRELLTLSFAASYGVAAGQSAKAAGLCWVYQTLWLNRIPEDPGTGKTLSVPNWQFVLMRQVGIEPDEYFSSPTYRPPSNGPVLALVTDEEGQREPTREPAWSGSTAPRKKASDFAQMRVFGEFLRNHRAADPEVWEPVLPYIATVPPHLQHKILARLGEKLEDLCERGILPESDQALARSLFSIFLDLGYVRSAINMLYCLNDVDPRRHLLPAARAVLDCMFTNQIAVSSKYMNEFLERLRKAWAQCSNLPITLEERFTLHETILGRYSAPYGDVTSATYRELVRTRLDPQDKPDLVHILNEKEDAYRLGVPMPATRMIAESVERLETEDLGPPLAISIVSLGNGASIISFGKKTGLSGKFIPHLNLPEATRGMLGRRRNWFRASADLCRPHDQVIWPKPFHVLRRFIVDLARRNGSRWIMLAIDPQGGCLPWQHLFSFADGRETDPCLVTLCPSLGWGAESTDRTPTGKNAAPVRLICGSDDPTVVEVRGRIEHYLDPEAQAFDLGLVLAHGTLPAGAAGVPTIKVGDSPLNLDEFCALSRHEVCVMHSCWTGGGERPRPWGDGLLATHLLGRRCSAVLAPVGAVAADAVEALQFQLSVSANSGNLGRRYLRAIENCPSVSLYNLYGIGAIRCSAETGILSSERTVVGGG